jgi:hypothetical protein
MYKEILVQTTGDPRYSWYSRFCLSAVFFFAFKIRYPRIFPLIIRGFGYQYGSNQKTLLIIDGIIGPTCAIYLINYPLNQM